MAATVLVDSTVLVKLVLGEPGADFAVNLFTRAEEDAETLIVTTAAIREAFEASVYAAVSSLVDSDDPAVLAEKIGEAEVRSEAYQRARPLVDYIARLARSGKIQVYAVNADDLAEALELAIKESIPLRDALTLYIANKMGVQKIASFSEYVRHKVPRNITVIPSL